VPLAGGSSSLCVRMIEQVPQRFRAALAAVVDRLVARDFDSVVARGGIGRWIRPYPATLIALPPQAWDRADAVPISTGGWSVRTPLWTEEEGRSDLTLTATVYESPLLVTNSTFSFFDAPTSLLMGA